MTMVIVGKRVVLSLLLLLLLASLQASEKEEDDFIISGYWPEFRTDYDMNTTGLYLTDLMLHSIEPTHDGSLTKCCLEEKNFKLAQQVKAYKKEKTGKDLRIWVAVGGWGRSNGFEGIVSDEKARMRFVFDLLDLCQKYDIGGVDLDWQEPVTRENTVKFLALLRTVKVSLGNQGIKVGTALQRGRELPTKAYRWVDRIHLLTYEMDLMSGIYHADFDKVRDTVTGFVSCPKKKLTIGLPLYSRVTSQPGQMRTIEEMVKEQANGDVETILKAESEFNGFVYDTPEKIEAKVRLALEMGLGGVHFWELGQDFQDTKYGPGGIMLQAVLDAKQKYQDEHKTKADAAADGAADEL
jgi:GH18 family chitinase